MKFQKKFYIIHSLIKRRPYEKTNYFYIGSTLLSFGMIDSHVPRQDSKSLVERLEEEKLRELELQRLEEERIKQYHEDELNRFLNDIGFRESGNRYDITNKWGYMGKYQFGKTTLKGLGFKVTKQEFLNNPQLQEDINDDFYYYTTKKNYKNILMCLMDKQLMECIFQRVVY